MAYRRAAFNPNRMAFEDGIRRIERVIKKTGISRKAVITSRDPRIRKATNALHTANAPKGFTKWQLPVYLDQPSQMFITIAAPGVKAPAHSHREGDGIRFIAGGSIRYRDTELSQGDWMFIPAGARYSFEVGPNGAIMCYCYCCCCA